MKSSVAKIAIISLLCATLVGALPGCAPEPKQTGLISDTIAATVNGIPVMESRVTDYIEAFRKTQDILQYPEEWAKTLANAKLTPETLRENIIETFVEEQLIRQAAKDYGIEPDRDVIDNTIDNSRLRFSSEEAWLEELTRVGYASEYEYRASLEDSYLRDALKEAAILLQEPTVEELQEVASEESRKYAGKRSAHILFRAEGDQTAEDVKAEAEQVEAQLDEGANFSEMAELFSEDNTTNKNGGDVGWDKLSPSYGSAYTTALDSLAVGEYSDPIETSFGIHIIYCTAEFMPDPGKPVPYESIPAEILKRISDDYVLEKQNQQFTDYINSLIAQATIVIAPMPDNLPYMVDMSLYLPAESDIPPSKPDKVTAPEAEDTAKQGSDSDIGETAGNGSDNASNATGEGSGENTDGAIVEGSSDAVGDSTGEEAGSVTDDISDSVNPD